MDRATAIKRTMELLAQSEEFIVFASIVKSEPDENGMVEAELLALTPDDISPEMERSIIKFMQSSDKSEYKPAERFRCRKEIQ